MKNHVRQKPIVFFSMLLAAVAMMAASAQASCPLIPIALSAKTLTGVAEGTFIEDIYNGSQPGNFGWLTWAGSPSEPVLANSLTQPGDSDTYINPSNPNDHEVSVGDWVRGSPGISNSRGVRDALDTLLESVIVVPVWDVAQGSGSNTLYHIVGFANVMLLDYHLPRDNRISAVFLGFTSCDSGGGGQD